MDESIRIDLSKINDKNVDLAQFANAVAECRKIITEGDYKKDCVLLISERDNKESTIGSLYAYGNIKGQIHAITRAAVSVANYKPAAKQTVLLSIAGGILDEAAKENESLRSLAKATMIAAIIERRCENGES